jgi:hypothetical protein
MPCTSKADGNGAGESDGFYPRIVPATEDVDQVVRSQGQKVVGVCDADDALYTHPIGALPGEVGRIDG